MTSWVDLKIIFGARRGGYTTRVNLDFICRIYKIYVGSGWAHGHFLYGNAIAMGAGDGRLLGRIR
jgi:hypothetical protein